MSSWLSRSHSDPKIFNKHDRSDITIDLHKILRSRPHLKWYKDKNKKWYIVHTQHSLSNAESVTKEIILPINAKQIYVNENELTTVRKTKANVNENDTNYRILNELINTIDILYRSLYKNTKQKLEQKPQKHIHNHNHTHDALNISHIIDKKTSQIKKKYKLKISEYEKEISSLKASFHNEQMQLREQNIILRKDYDNLSKIYNDLNIKYNTIIHDEENDQIKVYVDQLKNEIKDLKQQLYTFQNMIEINEINNENIYKNDSNHNMVNKKNEKHKIKAETTGNQIDNLQLISETCDIENINEEYMFHCELIKKNIQYYKEKKMENKKKKKLEKVNDNNINGDINGNVERTGNRKLNNIEIEKKID